MGFLTGRDLEASTVGGAALLAGSSRSEGGDAVTLTGSSPSSSSSALARRCEFVRAAARLCS